MTIEPIMFGDEIALVQDASALCLGKIGSGGGVCLRRDIICDIETHSRKEGKFAKWEISNSTQRRGKEI